MFNYLENIEKDMSCPICKSVNSMKLVDYHEGLLPARRIPKGFHQEAFFSFECSFCHSSFESKGYIIYPDKIFCLSEKTVSQKGLIPDFIERMGESHVFRNE